MERLLPNSITPSAPGSKPPDSAASDAMMELFPHIFGRVTPADFTVRLWDDRTWGPPSGGKPRFTLVLNHPGAVRRLLINPDLYAFGEAYVQGFFDVEGDLDAAYGAAQQVMDLAPSFADRLRYAIQSSRTLKIQTGGELPGFVDADVLGGARRARRAASYHYDHPREFWSHWLDQELVYSCAYFSSPDDTLDEAQKRKLDYVCRKLYLKPGERLLDVGCGWGALAIHAARHFGVHATGITLSQKQADHARARIEAEGLCDRCRVEVADYREWHGSDYDKIASLGMIEHVPQVFQHQYFERIREMLRPGGLFLNSGVARSAVLPSRGGSDFIERFVFPDSQVVPVSTMLRIAEAVGWEIRDVECLREHYETTLRRWRSRLEEHADGVRRASSERALRIFRIYLCGAAASFNAGGHTVYESLFALPVDGCSSLPATRDAWHAPGTAPRNDILDDTPATEAPPPRATGESRPNATSEPRMSGRRRLAEFVSNLLT